MFTAVAIMACMLDGSASLLPVIVCPKVTLVLGSAIIDDGEGSVLDSLQYSPVLVTCLSICVPVICP